MVYHRCAFTLQGGERTAPSKGFCPGKQRDDSLLPSNLKAYDPTGKYFIAWVNRIAVTSGFSEIMGLWLGSHLSGLKNLVSVDVFWVYPFPPTITRTRLLSVRKKMRGDFINFMNRAEVNLSCQHWLLSFPNVAERRKWCHGYCSQLGRIHQGNLENWEKRRIFVRKMPYLGVSAYCFGGKRFIYSLCCAFLEVF